jgi:hypothetical protein
MKIRDHPLMSYRSRPNWPPVWTQGTPKNQKVAIGELGILRYVHEVNPTSLYKFYLVIEHEKEEYVGTVIFDDLAFCRQIAKLLQQNIGRPTEEIGNLDVSHLL